MEFEADRMTNLVLSDEIVAPEREVVMEERRMRTDSDPSAQLDEAVQAALFTHHPYGKPIIGWGHEIEGLDRNDALAYYDRFYTPENAILVVAGDVEPTEVDRARRKNLRQDSRPRRGAEARASAGAGAARRTGIVTLADDKVEQPSLSGASISRPPIAPPRPASARRSRCWRICSAAAIPACSSRRS